MSAVGDPPPPYEAQDPAPRITPPSAQRAQSTFYHVYRSHLGNYRVLLDDQTPSFYIKSRSFRMPDLVVHQGMGDFDREIANCKFPDLGSQYDMNVFREANNKSSLTQTKMTLDGRFTATVPVLVPGTMGGPRVNAPRPFLWKQQTPSLLLIDGETGQIAAVVHGMDSALAKCFVLETQVQYGYGFEVLVVTSAVTIYEHRRRGDLKPPAAMSYDQRMGAGAGAVAAFQTGFSG